MFGVRYWSEGMVVYCAVVLVVVWCNDTGEIVLY